MNTGGKTQKQDWRFFFQFQGRACFKFYFKTKQTWLWFCLKSLQSVCIILFSLYKLTIHCKSVLHYFELKLFNTFFLSIPLSPSCCCYPEHRKGELYFMQFSTQFSPHYDKWCSKFFDTNAACPGFNNKLLPLLLLGSLPPPPSS